MATTGSSASAARTSRGTAVARTLPWWYKKRRSSPTYAARVRRLTPTVSRRVRPGTGVTPA
eukprot:10450685-Lingulodinium_polyedra.AAC.1